MPPSPPTKYTTLSNTKNSVQDGLDQNEERQRATRCIYMWILTLTVAVSVNIFISWQLRIQTNEQQIQLQQLSHRIDTLSFSVDELLSHRRTDAGSHFFDDYKKAATNTVNLEGPPQRGRVKRHNYPFTEEKGDIQIGRAFRWVDSNWTDEVGAKRKARRQLESIPDIVGDNNKQPEVDFFLRPQPTDQQSNASYEWLNSYFRIPVSG